MDKLGFLNGTPYSDYSSSTFRQIEKNAIEEEALAVLL